jgi:DNA-binding NtrC family response regulator
VRELQNTLERAAILCDDSLIRPEHLRLGTGDPGGPTIADVVDLSGTLAEVGQRAAECAEEAALRAALQEAEGDRAIAAKRLGLSVQALGRRVRELDPD